MNLNIYGLTLECQAQNDQLESSLLRPFKYFLKESSHAEYLIKAKLAEIPYQRFSDFKTNFITPRSIVYTKPGLKVIDYFGTGIVVEKPSEKSYELFSLDLASLTEMIYLLILSLFGQYCDRKGFLRIHALSLAYKNRALILMMPPGGGKSTLLLSLLEHQDIQILSDDIAVFDNEKKLLPFPLPIGIRDEDARSKVPQEFIWKEKRFEHKDKYRADLDFWKSKIRTEPVKNYSFLSGVRLLGGNTQIKKLSRFKMLLHFMRDAVFGFGLYQGPEFIFTRSSKEVLKMIPIFFRRFFKVLSLCLRHRTFEIYLSRDLKKNAECVEEFLKR